MSGPRVHPSAYIDNIIRLMSMMPIDVLRSGVVVGYARAPGLDAETGPSGLVADLATWARGIEVTHPDRRMVAVPEAPS